MKTRIQIRTVLTYLWGGLCGLWVLESCQRLDSNLYVPDTSIDYYALDEYTGFRTFDVPSVWDVPDSLIHHLTLVSDDAGDIAQIRAIYVGDTMRIRTDTIIMYCHGNANHMDYYWPRQKLLHNRGTYGVMNVDYRGYGLSEGPPTESGLVADVEAALQWLKDRGLTGDRLIIYGFSLGSIPATELAVNPRGIEPSKLILESPIGSIRKMVEDGAILTMAPEFYTDLKTDNIVKIEDHRHSP